MGGASYSEDHYGTSTFCAAQGPFYREFDFGSLTQFSHPPPCHKAAVCATIRLPNERCLTSGTVTKKLRVFPIGFVDIGDPCLPDTKSDQRISDLATQTSTALVNPAGPRYLSKNGSRFEKCQLISRMEWLIVAAAAVVVFALLASSLVLGFAAGAPLLCALSCLSICGMCLIKDGGTARR